jgi:hypothetical protein
MLMTRCRAFAAVLMVVLVLATCALVYAHTGSLPADACGQAQVWAPVKLASDNAEAPQGDVVAVPGDVVPDLGPDSGSRVEGPARSDQRPCKVFAARSIPRAPPAA